MTQQQDIDIPTFDPSSLEYRQDPYSIYRRLRETDPIHRHGDHAWVLTRYQDCMTVLGDVRYGSVEKARCFSDETSTRQVDESGKDFVGLRKQAGSAISPAVVRAIRPKIQDIVDTLFKQALDAGRVNLLEAFCYPLATTVFCDVFGVPQKDRARFRDWMEPLVVTFDAALGLPPDVLARRDKAWAEVTEYLKKLATVRRSDPQDDLISTFVGMTDSNGESWSDDDIAESSVVLLLAGHETSASLVGNVTLLLTRQPDALQQLRDDPEIWPLALEELLRYVTPAQALVRQVKTDDLEIDGQRFPQGDLVIAAIAAANRDPAVFDDPERLDLRRDPNPHIAFGYGPHFCLGSRLARAEAEITLRTLIQKAPKLSLVAEPTFKPTVVLRTLESLEIDLR